MPALDVLREHAGALTKATGLVVEVIPEQGTNRIFVQIRKVPLPGPVFSVGQTDVLFMADQMYPLSAIDMFYTEIDVLRHDGSIPQGAEAIEPYLSRS